ncbi:MAG: sulfite exporter TauE/SafE family protein [Armatimonadota bacterium]
MHLDLWQWFFGVSAAVIVGVSKTGVPGVGILVVTLLAMAFGGRQSVGIMLPMLIFADVFAVIWYHRHTQWDKLLRLFPWVVVGMAVGAVSMWLVGKSQSTKDILGIIIGALIIVMLVLHLLRSHMNDRLTPHSRAGVASTGVFAGFTTTVSNAAGPIMTIYLSALGMSKKEFMGTSAWYFFIINVSKVPIYIFLTMLNPAKPVISAHSLIIDAVLLPGILGGVFLGKWMLPRISQRAFNDTVLFLAAIGAIKLIIN